MSEDIHEKIGELRGQMTGMREQQTQIRDNISKLFKKIDTGNEKLTDTINAAMDRPCRKTRELEQMTQRCETAVKQASRVHADTKPVIEEFDRRRKSKARKLYERTEIRILVIGTFIIWLGSAIARGVSWIYHQVIQ